MVWLRVPVWIRKLLFVRARNLPRGGDEQYRRVDGAALADGDGKAGGAGDDDKDGVGKGEVV